MNFLSYRYTPRRLRRFLNVELKKKYLQVQGRVLVLRKALSFMVSSPVDLNSIVHAVEGFFNLI